MTKNREGISYRKAFDDEGVLDLSMCPKNATDKNSGTAKNNVTIHDNIITPIEEGVYEIKVDLDFTTKDFKSTEFEILNYCSGDWRLFAACSYFIPGIECDGSYYFRIQISGSHIGVYGDELCNKMFKFRIKDKGDCLFTNYRNEQPVKFVKITEHDAKK